MDDQIKKKDYNKIYVITANFLGQNVEQNELLTLCRLLYDG